MDLIKKTEAFLKETFAESSYMQSHPADCAYRIEHSYRVANIAKRIAASEGMDETYAVIAGLLHDIAYCEEWKEEAEWKNHGRRSAALARSFLEGLGLPSDAVNEICYGIAIHVDDKADFEWQRTPFCETVGDADNIDRFDAYRIYEGLQNHKFSELTLESKRERVNSVLGQLERLRDMSLGTQTAKKLWLERLDYYHSFYRKLEAQLNSSAEVL